MAGGGEEEVERLAYSLEWLRSAFEKDGYIAGEETLVSVYLSLRLGKPLLVEGPPGVGKTELAKVLARSLDTELIRLQCYEGLDENKALYEWNYQRQLLRIQLARTGGEGEQDLFAEEFLLERPLLRAIRAERKPVLLVDEVDKTDEEFEAFLFEVLSDFTVSVPELGTLRARQIPVVVLTSNNERELSDGLRRRCIYLYIDFPTVEKEVRIIRSRAPEVAEELGREIAQTVHYLRSQLEVTRRPSIAETLDWARALVALDVDRLSDEHLGRTANLLLKSRDDLELLRQEIGARGILGKARGDA
ncbi:MAG: MoxR family ATPase [bacterium]|nr:MoxR family ATPase [bacterium]